MPAATQPGCPSGTRQHEYWSGSESECEITAEPSSAEKLQYRYSVAGIEVDKVGHDIGDDNLFCEDVFAWGR